MSHIRDTDLFPAHRANESYNSNQDSNASYHATCGGWNVLRVWSSSNWDATVVMERLHSSYGVSPFFRVTVDHEYPSGEAVLRLEPAKLGLPHISYYLNGGTHPAAVAYKRLLHDTVVLLGGLNDDASAFSEDIFAYEHRLAEAARPGIFIDPGRTYRWPQDRQKQLEDRHEIQGGWANGDTADDRGDVYVTLGQLKGSAHMLPLQSILNGVFPRAKINDSTKLVLSSPHYVHRLSAIISTTDRGVLNNYLIWTLVRNYLPYMPPKYKKIVENLHSQITGMREELPRWHFCASLLYKKIPLAIHAILDNRTYPDSYVTTHFKQQSISDMFWTIKIAAIAKIKDTKWIEPNLKSDMVKMVKLMNVQVGVNPRTLEDKNLKVYYSSLIVQKNNLLQNVRFLHEFAKERQQKDYSHSLNADERLLHQMFNKHSVTYYKSNNIIVVPRFLVNEPYFHYDFPMSMQYGHLGVAIATALARGVYKTELLYSLNNMTTVDFHFLPKIGSPVETSGMGFQISLLCIQNWMIHMQNINASVANVTRMNTWLELTGVQLAVEGLQIYMENQALSRNIHEHLSGLDLYEDVAVFGLSYAQDHCAIISKEQEMVDAFAYSRLDRKSAFLMIWSQMNIFSQFLGCKRRQICPEYF